MASVAVWRLSAHHADPDFALRRIRRGRRIALGWGQVGSLRKGAAQSAEEIARWVEEAYPQVSNAAAAGASLWNLYAEMQIGDLVLVSVAGTRRMVLEITGDYFWAPPVGMRVVDDYHHRRRVVPVDLDPDRIWKRAGAKVARGQSIQWPLVRLARKVPYESGQH